MPRYYFKRRSETEPRLKLNNSAGQKTRRLAEVDPVNTSAIAEVLKRSNVCDVENVKEVKANIQIRLLTENTQIWQPESF